MTVEQGSLLLRVQPSQQRNARTQLVYHKDIRLEAEQLIAKKADRKSEMYLPQYRKEDMESIEDSRWKDRVSSNSNI